MNYRKAKLSDIGKIVSGATPKTKDPDNYDGDIAWITPADLSKYNKKYISHGARSITQKGYDSCSTQLMPKGTVLFSSRAPIGYVAIAENALCTNQGFKSIIPGNDIDSEFLYYQLKYLKKEIQEKGSGTTFKEISAKTLGEVFVTVPPLDEQSRIVARIEELFSELDKAVDTLKTTKEQLEVYRHTILVDAFRAATNSTYLKVGCVCAKIVDCPHSTPKWEKSGKLCLRTTNFKRGYLDLQSPNYVSEETFHDRNRRIIPQPGDVLYSREGSVLGIACTIPSNVYPCLGQRMMLLRSGEKLNNRYLMHYLNSPMVTNHVIATKGGTGSPHINVGDIKEFKIPIPSLEEQSNIVRQIEEQLSSCDNVEKTVDAILAQADAMRQSILKQAFEGKL